MTLMLAHAIRRLTTLAVLALLIGPCLASAVLAQETPSGIAASRTDLLSMTATWGGDRFPDGRPKVPEDSSPAKHTSCYPRAGSTRRERSRRTITFPPTWRRSSAFSGSATSRSFVPRASPTARSRTKPRWLRQKIASTRWRAPEAYQPTLPGRPEPLNPRSGLP